jgi:hypothetical protein
MQRSSSSTTAAVLESSGAVGLKSSRTGCSLIRVVVSKQLQTQIRDCFNRVRDRTPLNLCPWMVLDALDSNGHPVCEYS